MKKAECQRIDAFKLVLEKTLESPLECKDFEPILAFNPKEISPVQDFGRTDAEAETPILWPSHAKN